MTPVRTSRPAERAAAITVLRNPQPGLAAARAALALARAAEEDAAGEAGDRDRFQAVIAEAVLGYRLLLTTLLVRDPATVRYAIDGVEVSVQVSPPDSLLSANVILESIMTAWCAGDFEAAALFGGVPTQRFKTKLDDRDRTQLMTVFAVASIARGNGPAFQRAEAGAIEADAAGQTLDPTVSRGGIIPLLKALSAIGSGKRRIAERALAQLSRFHGWRTRETPHLAGFDRWTTAVTRFARHQGMPLPAVSPAVPAWITSDPA